jgi:hypothetical protein
MTKYDINNNINSYMCTIHSNINVLFNNRKKCKNKCKITNEKLIIPTINTISNLFNYVYNVQQLKIFAKHYNLKLSGNKKELFIRIYTYLFLTKNVITIQSFIRSYQYKKYKWLHGPGLNNRTICTNNTDFLTMEPLNTIPYNQFISYIDEDKFVYGFDIISLYNLILKNKKCPLNPYNRNNVPPYIINNIKSIVNISKILKIPINITLENINDSISEKQLIELRILDVFQEINLLGNYSEMKWFTELNIYNLKKYIRYLEDVWNYRAQITDEVKRNICPPYGNPFSSLNFNKLQIETNIDIIIKQILNIIEIFVYSGITEDDRALGANYVLGALTLVNINTATSIPWLYQSFYTN